MLIVEIQKLVDAFFDGSGGHEDTPLILCAEVYKASGGRELVRPEPPDAEDIDALVLWAIKQARSYSTYTEHLGQLEYQCRTGAYRSSGDLWRIIKQYRDDISLFDVIGAMVRLADAHTIQINKCYDIYRYICYLCRGGSFHVPEMYECDCGYYDDDGDWIDEGCDCGKHFDEYGLAETDWRYIESRYPNRRLEWN